MPSERCFVCDSGPLPPTAYFVCPDCEAWATVHDGESRRGSGKRTLRLLARAVGFDSIDDVLASTDQYIMAVATGVGPRGVYWLRNIKQWPAKAPQPSPYMYAQGQQWVPLKDVRKAWKAWKQAWSDSKEALVAMDLLLNVDEQGDPL